MAPTYAISAVLPTAATLGVPVWSYYILLSGVDWGATNTNKIKRPRAHAHAPPYKGTDDPCPSIASNPSLVDFCYGCGWAYQRQAHFEVVQTLAASDTFQPGSNLTHNRVGRALTTSKTP